MVVFNVTIKWYDLEGFGVKYKIIGNASGTSKSCKTAEQLQFPSNKRDCNR